MSDEENVLYQSLLEKHIENKINQVFKRKFRQHESNSEDGDVDMFSEPTPIVSVRGDIVPIFDPDDKSSTVTGWLQKIDQLGEIHGWSDYHKTAYMQQKLRGSARSWFNRLDDYKKSWDEWKIALTRAFPRCVDYATVLEDLVNRKKRSNETMTHYYHEKLSLIQQCRLDNDAAISCIIRGLPLELQANARAFQCSTTDELYAGFIAPLENYHSPRDEPKSKRPRYEAVEVSHRDTRKRPPLECYNCGKPGHIAKECRLKGTIKCFLCHRFGHKKENCRLRNPSSSTTSPSNDASEAKTVRLINNNVNNIYKKLCLINGLEVRAYLDSGSQENIIHSSIVEKLKIPTYVTNSVLTAFGGNSYVIRSGVNIHITLDGIELNTFALVTERKMGDFDLLVGQPIINADGVSLIIHSNEVKLTKDIVGLLDKLTLDSEEPRPLIRLEESKALQPWTTTMVPVHITDVNEEEDIVMEGKKFREGRSMICIPSTVFKGSSSMLAVSNMSDEETIWTKGRLIGRGYKCIEAPRIEENAGVSELQSSSTICSIAVDEVDMNDNLDIKIKDDLLKLLSKWQHCFSNNTRELGTVRGYELNIKLIDEAKPICYRPYRLPIKEREVVRDKVDELLEAGIIRESKSNFASPIVLVKKKTNEYRLCCDYRALNKATIKDIYPMSNIEEQLNLLGGKLFFTSLDCNQGFHQIAVAPDSIAKTAFITPDGHFEFLKMPFGLVNAPAVFQRAINNALGNLRYGQVLVYMDDLLVPSITAEQGLELLEEVFQLLCDAGFKLNLKKCSFLKQSIQFLGHEVGANGISPGEAKIDAVKNFKQPTNAHEIRQFLGLAGYFRKFVQNFATIALPLTQLTKKNAQFRWEQPQMSAFCQLKEMLIAKPILMPFNPKLSIEIHTDASSKGLGGIFFQVHDSNNLKPVAYFSRVTSPAERVYHSYELETLAIVESLRRFRIYILGYHFKIVTDCSAVRYTFSKRDLIPRIARWWLSVQDFDFEVIHKPGTSMKHVDALSRNPSDVLQISVDDDWFLAVQMQDEILKNIIEQLKEKSSSDLERQYVYRNNRLYRKVLDGERLVIPKFARFQFLQKYHDSIGHPGFTRCLGLIKNQFWFAKMTRFVRKYVNSCLDCGYKKGNYGKPEGELHPIPKRDIPMHTVHIDFVGPFPKSRSGFSYILTLIDSFTKFVVAKPSRTLGSAECLRNLREIFGGFLGYPKRIVSDNGLAFTSRYFKEYVDSKQIKHVKTATATPRANGQVERFHRTLLNAIRTMTDDNDVNWNEKIPDVVWGINNTVNDSTKHSPFELLFGYKGNLQGNLETPSTSVEFRDKRKKASDNLEKVAKRMKGRFDKKHKPVTKYKKGDLVLWKGGSSCNKTGINHKLTRKYSGPYIVVKVFDKDRYKINSVKGMKGYRKFDTIVAADSLRPVSRFRKNESSEESSDSESNIRDRDDLIDLLES